MWHWLLHVLGVDDVSGRAYAFWSGFGSDVAEFALIGALAGLLRKHNCAVRGCWRVGRHKAPGTDHLCCARHTPGGAPTHARILALHRQRTARASEAGERLYQHGGADDEEG